jgi:hypothetical protein
MGNRAQVAIKGHDKACVYLYTHWQGHTLANTVKRALTKQWRWDDPEYLARIVFCEMVKGAEADETGFGIGTSKHGDLNNPLIVLDCNKQTVTVGRKGYTFAQYTMGD